MNDRNHGSTSVLLPDALQAGWWFGSSANSGTSENYRDGAAPSLAQPTTHSSLFCWWPFGGAQPAPRPPVAQRAQGAAGTKPRLSRPRSAASLDGAAARSKQPRPPRVASASRLQPGAGHPAGADAQAAAGPAVAADSTAKKPLSSRQPKADGQQKAGGKPSLNKQLSYQERRRMWRQRLEHANAKANKRVASTAAAEVTAEGQAGSAARKFSSRHIAIPASKLGSSSQSTPAGSPGGKRGGGLASEVSGDQPAGPPPGNSSPPPDFLDVPPIWQGFETAEAPADFTACSEEELLRFLAQAGRPLPSSSPPPEFEGGLAAVARECRGAWEVERIMVACQWPQEVLRVPRHSDPAALKAAYRRVSIAVHPDKNMAAGASDAMSIVADAYHIIMAGRSASTIPAFMRQNHPTRQSHLNQGGSAAAPAPSGAGPFPDPQGPAPKPTAHPDAAGPGYAESTLSHTSSYADLEGQLQEPFFVEAQHTSSGEAEAVLETRPHQCGTDGQEHWNPHGHLSSTEELSPQPAPAAAGATLGCLPSGDGLSAAEGSATGPASQAGTAQGQSGSAGTAGPAPAAGLHGGAPAGASGGRGASQAGCYVAEQPPPQSPAAAGGSGSSSRVSTPERPSSATPGHSRSSSAQSLGGWEAAGAGAAPSASGQGPAGRGAPSGKPPLSKIRVTVKYKTAGKQ